jgi:hypothetical protein
MIADDHLDTGLLYLICSPNFSPTRNNAAGIWIILHADSKCPFVLYKGSWHIVRNQRRRQPEIERLVAHTLQYTLIFEETAPGSADNSRGRPAVFDQAWLVIDHFHISSMESAASQKGFERNIRHLCTEIHKSSQRFPSSGAMERINAPVFSSEKGMVKLNHPCAVPT